MPTYFTDDASTQNTVAYAYTTGYANNPITSNVLLNLLNTKQNTLNSNTNLLGIGGSITGLNYNNISNAPTLTNSQWANNGIDISYNAGSVGIGTNTPTQKLEVAGNIKTQQLYINNPNSTASIFFSPTPSIYSIFSKRVPWAMYFAEDYDSSTNTLPNYISNGRDATGSGTITKTTASGNGATAGITSINGGIATALSFPTGSIPTNFTILGLIRHTNSSANLGRLLASQTNNWLLGYNVAADGEGVAYLNGWKTPQTSFLTTKTDWLCIIGKNGGSTPNNILANGIARGTATGGDGGSAYRLGINNDPYGSITKSDWALSCVMIWDSILTDDEMFDLNTIINKYKNDGVSIKSLLLAINDDECCIESRVYGGTEKTELLLFKGNDPVGTNGADRIRLRSANIAFDTYSSTTTDRNTENIKMLINQDGNIGIGTITPNYKLDINGDLNASNIYGNGSNISNINYNNIPNAPSLAGYATTSQLALKQNVLSNSTVLLGTGGSITGLNYNNISNAPSLTGYATTSQLALKQDTLTTSTILLGNGGSITGLNYNNISNAPTSTGYITTSQLALKQDLLSNSTLLLGNGSNISNLNYNNIPNKPDLSTYATITNLNAKENALTFSAPLTRTTNTISLDLSSYLTSATASGTYATITNLNAKENALTFSAPLIRATNTISLDLSSYLTSSTASSTYATITNLNTKENALTFSAPLTRTANTISLDTSTYITTTNANLLNNRFFNNTGNLFLTYNNFNTPTDFGCHYIAGTTNAPSIPSAYGHFYSWDIGIGSEYYSGSPNGSYRVQLTLPRNTANPYLCVRFQENNSYGSWYKLSCAYADTADALSAGTKLIQGGLNLTATNPAVYFQGGTAALGYASTGGAYSGSAAAGDLVLRSDTNKALILQSGAGTFAIGINPNNTVSFSGNLLLPASWKISVSTYGGSADSLGLYHTDQNSVWYFRGTQYSINQDISDIRTKINIENIDDSLTLINQLEPKKYIKLVDRDEIKEYGFIAQDIQKIIPEVVYNEPYYIADIYEDCEFDNETKIFISTKDQSSILTVGTKIKIVLDKKEGEKDINNINNKWCCMETEIIEVIDEFTYKIKDNADINEEKIFIYGTLKQDFKTLDYKSLHAITIQATKDLYAIIKDLQERIRILEAK